MTNTRPVAALALAGALLLGLRAAPASAELFSVTDGFAPDGTYRFQGEVIPYLWVPASSGSIHLPRTRAGSVDFSSGFPSASELTDTLHGAFMGAGLLRYGPWSGEIDIQYVDASQSRTLATLPGGGVLRVNTSASLVRVAPGFGYKVYSGAVAGVPVMVDARAGFAVFADSESLKGEGDLRGELSGSGSFVQPWLGGRATFVPSPRWRVAVDALVQGLGVDGGSWGYGASLLGSYAFNRTINVTAGFRAIESSRAEGRSDLPGASRRSLSLLVYGPFIGVGLRF